MLPPYYYEYPFNNQTNSKNEDDCFKDCKETSDCIQYIFFKRENPALSINNKNSCYLKSKLNIFNGILIDSNTSNAYNIKSINQFNY